MRKPGTLFNEIMLRLFKYENCAEYKDFPNHLFRANEYGVSFDHENDQVLVNGEPYKISTILHIQGSGTASNGIQLTLFNKLKTNIRSALETLFKC